MTSMEQMTLRRPQVIIFRYLIVLKAMTLGSRLKQARFSALTFFSHCEQVYMLSPSRVSLTVTSSRDWYRFRISVTYRKR